MKLHLDGKTFGRLTVIRRVLTGRSQGTWRHETRLLCQCECGRQVVVPATRLSSSETRSCGCLRSALTSERMRKTALIHGRVRTPEYRSYYQLRGACQNKTHKEYPRCGALGIEFRFANFPAFFEAVGEKPPALGSNVLIPVGITKKATWPGFR